jgi:hypothetical protein
MVPDGSRVYCDYPEEEEFLIVKERLKTAVLNTLLRLSVSTIPKVDPAIIHELPEFIQPTLL